MAVSSAYLEEGIRKSLTGLKSYDLIKKSLVYASNVTLEDGEPKGGSITENGFARFVLSSDA